MNKATQISNIAKKAGITKSMASEAYDAFVDTIHESLAESGEAVIQGLGKFSLTRAKERTARNPRTGEMVVVPEHVKVTFKPATGLKNYVQEI